MAKLKTKLNKEEFSALSETMQELYVASGDGFILDADIEDVSGLKSALEKEKEERRQAKELLKKFEGLDVDAAREALLKITDLEEKKLRSAGEYDKLKEQLVAKQAEELRLRDAKEAALNEKLKTLLIDQAATEAISKAGGNVKLLLPHVKNLSRVVEKDGNYEVEILDSKGTPRIIDGAGNPFTFTNLIEEFKTSDDYAGGFSASGISGSGSPQFTLNSGGKRTVSASDKEALNANIDAIAKGDVVVTD